MADKLRPKHDPAVDAYIAAAQPFAQPILRHLRALVHATVPEVTEAMKWRFPNFVYRGLLCNMAAFKAHCAFGFWKHTSLVDARGKRLVPDAGMGSMGKLTSLADLPSDAQLKKLLLQAKQLNESPAPRKPKAPPRKALAVPAAMKSALAKNARAKKFFAELSPSCRYEYVDWISEAKRDATRDARIATAMAWLAEGKRRHWKYER
jgi:uncharacterized protein YdeI (YjbR/CyaY-like superfamily)